MAGSAASYLVGPSNFLKSVVYCRQALNMPSLKFWPNQWVYLAFFVVVMSGIIAFSNFYINLICWGSFSIFFADICVKAYEVFVYKRKFLNDAKNKAVLVTGCDTGFGVLFSEELAKMGYLVYSTVLDPNGDGPKTLQTLDNIVIVRLDVTDQTSVDKAVEFVKADLKKRGDRTFWSLVNNAGVAVYCDVEFASLDHFQRIMDVNAFGVVRMCKGFLPLLRAAGGGRIVNISSQSRKNPVPCMTAYSMSKSALFSFVNGLRLELKPWNISVHTIEPFYYLTAPTWEEAVKPYQESYMKLWHASPDEVKQAYGVAYREEFMKSFIEFTSQHQNPREKLHEVVDDVVHTVAGSDPNILYTPGTTVKMIMKIMSFLPQEVADIFLTPEVRVLPAALTSAHMAARKHS